MSITNFYANQEIFITGGSGFIGKGLIEKIVRSFPNFGKMFILIRSKNGKSPNERLQDILKTGVFERARNEQPQAFSKIFAVSGDCQELNLAIAREDLERIKNVSVIFHSAASVRFDDHLKYAILLNMRGTHELVKIAKTMKNLKAFVHISTSYSNPDMRIVEERIYPPCADWRTTLKLAETYDVETLNVFFSKYSSHQPNTYTFTKGLSEHIINDYRSELPVMIHRPSIVVSSIEEPYPGWVDNFNGPMGMLVACGIGLLRTNYVHRDVVIDIIPADITIRSLLICAYKLEFDRINLNSLTNKNELYVVNCSNDCINAITLSNIIKLGKIEVIRNPFEKCVMLPGGSITKCAVWHYIRFFSVQICLALVIDLLLRLAKQKPFFLKLQRRICAANTAVYVFMSNEWKFANNNLIDLEKLIPEEEYNKLGMMCYSKIKHEFFIRNGIKGAKRFLLNEPMEATQQARMRIKILYVLHYLMQFVGIFLVGKLIYTYLQKYF